MAEKKIWEKIKIPFWGKILLMCAVVFLASIGYLKSFHTHNDAANLEDIQQMPANKMPRKDVPDIVLISKSGPSKKLSDYKGKVVLLSFWASWCTPCLVELPTFIEIHEKLSSKGFVILPVNVDEPDVATDFVVDYWKTKKFPFETFYDTDKKAADTFQIDTLPSNFILDKNGKLVATGYGANDWASEASIEFIEQLLTE
ncbi:MAG: TlpA family protein disulfide reductase [Oligoflexia bacterium]|nr:TlpA family protein disulfide reductase [Oligoflexia bacterium]